MKKLPLAATLTMTLFGCVGVPLDGTDTAALAVSSLPRMVAPLHGAVMGTQRPVFRVEGPVRAGSRLELCADRDCAVVEQSTPYYAAAIRAVGTLTPGLHFWRIADGAGASTAWAFYAPHHDSNESATTAYNADFNGDGTPDSARRYSNGAAVLHDDVPTSLIALRVIDRPDALATLGDVNGDGYTDLAVTHFESGALLASVFLGAVDGATPRRSSDFAGNVRLRGVGDVNRDGYADVLVDQLSAVPSPNGGAPATLTSALHLGGPGGVGAAPARRWDRPVLPAGDINGDGFADLRVDLPLTGPGGAAGVYFNFHLGGANVATLRERALRPPAAWVAAGRYFSAANTAVGDLNGDGLNDVLVSAGGLVVYFPTTQGFRAAPDHEVQTPFPLERTDDRDFRVDAINFQWFRGVGDLNGDGFDDLTLTAHVTAVRGSYDHFTVWRIDGRRDRLAEPVVGPRSNYFPFVYRVGDRDGDTLDDLMVLNRGFSPTPIPLAASF